MIRIASFNVENLEEDLPLEPGQERRGPTFDERAAVLRPALERMRADIIAFQEVHGQERPGQPRDLLALKALLAPTSYADFTLVTTQTKSSQEPYDKRNLVVALRPDMVVEERIQINQDETPAPEYRRTIGVDEAAKPVRWERPLLCVKIRTPAGREIHILNVHFKSKLAVRDTDLMEDRFTWKSSAAWAEGFFLSSMKRVGAALEARVVIDGIFDADPNAAILIAGDFNALSDEVPVVAIRGRVEDTGNAALSGRVMLPLEDNVPSDKRFTLYHKGKGEMIDHILASRSMVQAFSHTEIHNEFLPDESIAFATDAKFPESDHAPVVAVFDEAVLSNGVA